VCLKRAKNAPGVSLDFRILGPFEVCEEDGRALALGGRKRRAVLALLVLNRNEFVPSDRLLEEIWGGSPESTPSLQVYVSQLRKLIGGAHVLQTRPGGYSLAVADDQLDAARFERLFREAKQALADGRPEPAADQLRQALALWRGSPLADFVYESFAQAEIARLAELRLVALELRIEAELALGHHADLVSELETLVAEEPLRERVHGYLMLALYRSGRQADALAAYHNARRTLLDQLGLEPSLELKELEAAILRQDRGLAVEPAELRARRHLPAPATALVGREKELAEIVGLLRQDAPRLLTLTGPGGTGKTRLALQAASDVVDRFPDGVFFVGLGPLEDSELVPATIAGRLGVKESAERPLLESLKEHLRDKRLLLVLDNFEHVDDAAPIVSELLAEAPGFKAVVTSRTLLRLYGEHDYAVPPLTEDEAAELFAMRARAVRMGFELDGTRPQVIELCQRLDCLPLAIELAAARSNELSPAEMLAALPRRLELATRGARDLPLRQQTLRATIEWSYGLLDEHEQTLFARVAAFAGGWSLDAAKAVCDAALAELASLVEKSLVLETEQADGEPGFAMLETVREYAAEQLDATGAADGVRRRHAEYFLSFAEQAKPELEAGAEMAISLVRLELEHDNLRAALAWFAAQGEAELELRLAIALKSFWWVRGHFGEGRRAVEGALSRADSAAPQLRADALTTLGVLAYRQGALDAAKAAWEESLELYRKLGDSTGVARSVGELGSVAIGEGDYARAVALYEESAALFREAGDTMRLASVVANLGAVANMQGDFERGRPLIEEALALHREVGAKDDIALTLQNLGRVALQENRHLDAAQMLHESLELSRDLSYREMIAYGLEGLAELAAAREDPHRAARLLGAADAVFQELGIVLQEDDRERYDCTVRDLRAGLGETAFEAARAAGAALELDRAVEEALKTRMG
jgi:predicted ATPase/DNA-binding SARP family transcriptional activator